MNDRLLPVPHPHASPHARSLRGLATSFGLAAILAAGTVHAQVTLKIHNQSGKEIWVMWTGTNGLTGSSNGIDIAPSDFGSNAAGYPLSGFAQVSPNVYQIDGFTMGGGRMWFTYGSSSWTFPSAGYSPSLANFNDPQAAPYLEKIVYKLVKNLADSATVKPAMPSLPVLG